MDSRRRSLLAENEHDNSGRQWNVLGSDDAGDNECMQDIIRWSEGDDSGTERFVSEVLVGTLLEHFLFRGLILFVITSNAIIISIQTSSPAITKKYEIVFTVCEHIILTVFTWEILVKWFYGFAIFWRNGWNHLDCLVTACLLVGPMVFSSGANIFKVMRVLRVVRCVSSFTTMHGVAMMMHVILQSLPDLINIFLLLVIIMMVFAVFGVNLFSASVPSAFGDLTAALYTLFICITQDGWMTIYNEFQEGGASLLYGASLYFFIFLTLGAFIFGNLFGAVVTTNLEISMADMDEKNGSDNALAMPDDLSMTDTSMIHCEEVVARTSMTRRQKPWKASCLENLRVETFEDLALILSAMQKNKKEYKKIRQELEKIVEEVHNLPFNREQENAVIMRDQNATTMKDFLTSEVTTGRTGDMLSTLIALEKAHVIDSGTDSPAAFQRGLRHEAMRRMSMDSTNTSAVPHSS